MKQPMRVILETLQRMVARLVATSPAGERLILVGGMRYRLLDGSCRSSLDIDYHWDGDLAAKRDELLALLERKLLPEMKRRLGHDGAATAVEHPAEASPSVKTAMLAAFRPDVRGSRIELPVDVTRIACLDPPIVRTIGGTVYLTASDGDMAESKVIALVERVFTQDRDLLDLFLFRSGLPEDARARLEKKLSMLTIQDSDVERRLQALGAAAAVRARGVDRIIDEQVDGPAASNLKAAGGGELVCRSVLELLEDLLGKR